MVVLAATADADAGAWFLTVAVLLLAGAVVLSPFGRRIGGKGGGSEKASVGAWLLVAALLVGLLVATNR